MRKELKQIQNSRKVEHKKELGLYLTPYMPFSYNNMHNFIYTAVRGIGKSVISVEVLIILKRKYGYENVKGYYFRLTDLSIKAMLANHAQKAIDPYLVQKYDLEITCKGNTVYDHGKPLLEFYPLVSAANVGKGVNLYDCNFFTAYYKDNKKRFIVTIWDEFIQDEGVSKRSVGDPVKQYKIYREAIYRDAQNMPYNCSYNFFLANNCAEIASITGQLFNYIPDPNNHNRVKLTRKHAVFWNVPVSEAYKNNRRTSINSDMIDLKNDSNYAEIQRDMSFIKPKKTKIRKVTQLIKFSKDKMDWFCVYDGKYIREYHNETVAKSIIVPMRRHVEEIFNLDAVNNIFDRYDAQAFMYCDILSMATFAAKMKLLKAK